MDGIIFDMDGTMWDSSDEVAHSWNKVISARGINKQITRDDMKKSMGMNINEIMDKFFPKIDKAQKDSLRLEMCNEEQVYLGEHGGKLYEGLEETLEYLSQKYELFIVSNCQHGYIQSFFKAHGFEKYFSDYECAGSTGLHKNENILLLAHRNNLNKYAYIGDTQIDLEAAKDAGAEFVYASYGFGKVDEDDCDYVIDKLTDLKEIF